MPKVMKAMTISDNNKSNEEMEQKSKPRPDVKQPVLEID
jgi:hypothetical protein